MELAIVLCMSGFLIGGFFSVFSKWVSVKHRDITVDNMSNLEEALDDYKKYWGYFPCPARLDLHPSDDDFGKEDCSISSVDGVLIGMSPLYVRDSNNLISSGPINDLLGKPRDLDSNGVFDTNDDISSPLQRSSARDGWGNKIVYAVTKDLVDETTYSNSTGIIEIHDTLNREVLTKGSYFLFSAGENMKGAYPFDKTTKLSSCSGSSMDKENCDKDNVFRSGFHGYSSNVSGSRYFDDIVAYGSKMFVNNGGLVSYEELDMGCSHSMSKSDHNGCATAAPSGTQLYIRPSLGETPATNGVKLFSETVEGTVDGSMYIRAFIPIRYEVEEYFDDAFIGAIYVDNKLLSNGLLYMPGYESPIRGLTGGGTGVVFADVAIVKGEFYDIDVYAYSLGNQQVTTSEKVWLGTIDAYDTYEWIRATGVVEVMQGE